MLNLYIDADGCPVKDEVYKVAHRYQLKVFVVANKKMHVPFNARIELITVPGGLDEADHWIVEHIEPEDIAVTADIPLADRCLKKGARVLGTKGEEFTEDSIGGAMATRELLQHLRETGEARGGPPPMTSKHRSQFLSQLDQIVQSIRRKNGIK